MNSDGKVLRKAVETDVPAILEYLGRDIPNCLYLYLDVYTYGVTDPNITVWFSEAGGKISLVIMKYYDSFQIYSDREDCDIAAISDMINEYDIGTGSCDCKVYATVAPTFPAPRIVIFFPLLLSAIVKPPNNSQ